MTPLPASPFDQRESVRGEASPYGWRWGGGEKNPACLEDTPGLYRLSGICKT